MSKGKSRRKKPTSEDTDEELGFFSNEFVRPSDDKTNHSDDEPVPSDNEIVRPSEDKNAMSTDTGPLSDDDDPGIQELSGGPSLSLRQAIDHSPSRPPAATTLPGDLMTGLLYDAPTPRGPTPDSNADDHAGQGAASQGSLLEIMGSIFGSSKRRRSVSDGPPNVTLEFGRSRL